MLRPIEDWDELYLAGLPINEDYLFDRKSGAALIELAGSSMGRQRNALSCDVSSFANSRSGGLLIFGVADDGLIDGVPLDLKRGGSYGWLDSIIPSLVQPRLHHYKLRQINRDSDSSRIPEGCAVFVLEIPSSEDAPHQASDNRYYFRNNGKKEAADHAMVEDIRARAGRRPLLSLKARKPRWNSRQFSVEVELKNGGRTASRECQWEVEIPTSFVSSRAPSLTVFDPYGGTRPGRAYRRNSMWRFEGVYDSPVFAGRSISFFHLAVSEHRGTPLNLRWRLTCEGGEFPPDGEFGVIEMIPE